MSNETIIIMPTYYRLNCKTKDYLTRSIESVINQTYTYWKLVIISDKYEPLNEFEEIVDKYNKICDNRIIKLYNTRPEREYVKDKGITLWHCAGVNACNMGMEYGIKNNYKYFFHIDDDDHWKSNHLYEHMNIYEKYDNCVFVVTKSTYCNSFLPKFEVSANVNDMILLPRGGGMIHSSFSFRNDIMKIYYDTADENGLPYPADCEMLSKISDFIKQDTDFCSIYVPKHTCYHDEEFCGYT
jgi:glycosyltransferase involved in cell wall biosynthesis